MKYFILLGSIIFLTSCATLVHELGGVPNKNTFDIIEDLTTNSGNWKTIKLEDPFDGEEIYSSVSAEFGSGEITVITDSEGRRNIINYRNGDGYICGSNDTYSNNLSAALVLTKNSSDEKKKISFNMAVSSSGNALILFGSNCDWFIELMNEYDAVTIRTNDKCGEQKTKTFNIEGTTHLVPYEEDE